MEASGSFPAPLAIRTSAPVFRPSRTGRRFRRIGGLAVLLALVLSGIAFQAPPVFAQSLQRTADPPALDARSESPVPGETLAPGWIPAVSVTIAFALLLVFLVISVCIPRPTPNQLLAFRVVLALAAAACGATIACQAPMEMAPWKRLLISAGGSLLLFLVVFQIDPPGWVRAGRSSGEPNEKAGEGKRG